MKESDPMALQPSIVNRQSSIPSPDLLRQELQRLPRLLLIRLRSLGDSILSLPLLESLHCWRPDLDLDVLSEAPFAAVFSNHPAVHETLILRPRAWPGREGWTRTAVLKEIRRRRYPVVLNLHGGTTSMIFTLASGARLRIGQKNYRNVWAYNAQLPPSNEVWNRKDLHTVEHQMTLLRWAGIPVPLELEGRLHIEPKARAQAQERQQRSGIEPQKYVLVHPTATLFTKQWQEGNFAQLADELSGRFNLPVIFTSARNEERTLTRIASTARRKHLYWSDLALAELFAVIEGCSLFVGNDSGPAHAAAALKKPMVVVWGSSNSVAWHPWRTNYELVRSDFPCMPCPGYTCHAFGRPRCILDIPVDRVLLACERILSGHSTE